jgi:hypothetical protein
VLKKINVTAEKVENEHEDISSNSENVIENKEYIKRLELQRFVLEKMVSSDISQIISISSVAHDNPDSN